MVRNPLAGTVTATAITTAFAALALLAWAPAQAAQQGTVIVQPDRNPDYNYNYNYNQQQRGPAYMPAPPQHRPEAYPRPRRGQVWVEGHWQWHGRRYVWVPGYWVQTRPGYRYRQPVWVQRNGEWQLRGGGWDRDGDGVPNRHDRRPGDSYRY